MRDTFFPVVLIGAILAGVVFYYRASLPGIIPSFSARSGPVESDPEIAAKPKELKKQPATKSSQVRKSSPQDLSVSPQSTPGSVVTVIISDEPASGTVRTSFPVGSDIKPGMEGSQIRDRFGNPDLDAKALRQ